MPFSGDSREATSAYSPSPAREPLRERVRGQVVRQHARRARRGRPSRATWPAAQALGATKRSTAASSARLVDRERGRVGGGLGQRAAAVEHAARAACRGPWQRKHGAPSRSPKPVAQKRRTLCRCSTTRAPRLARGGQARAGRSAAACCARARPSAPSSRTAAATLARPVAAAQQRGRGRARGPRRAERALEQRVRDARAVEGLQLELDRALLAALDAVAVVQQRGHAGRSVAAATGAGWLTYRADARAAVSVVVPDAQPGRLPGGDPRFARAPRRPARRSR